MHEGIAHESTTIFQNLAVSNVVSNAINVGLRLDLFKILSEISSEASPVLPEHLANAAGCKERFVHFSMPAYLPPIVPT